MNRHFDKEFKLISFHLEIAYSTGRLKDRHIVYVEPVNQGLVWNYATQLFEVDHPDAFKVNYRLLRFEDFIRQVFIEDLQGNIYIDDCIDILLQKVNEKEQQFGGLMAKTDPK